jgi:TonB family protein
MSGLIKIALSNYGAWELKSTYQRNLMLGTLFNILLVSTIIGGALIYQLYFAPIPEAFDEFKETPKRVYDFGPPPSISPEKPRVNFGQPRATLPPIASNLIPVADEELGDEYDVSIATIEDVATYVDNMLPTAEYDPNNAIIVFEESQKEWPTRDEFIITDKRPEMIFEAKPEFPRLASMAGMSGHVWVAALVDEEGNVHEAVIVKSSNSNLGFEEAALRAAYKNKFTPAIRNGHPIALWVTYQVVFELEDDE